MSDLFNEAVSDMKRQWILVVQYVVAIFVVLILFRLLDFALFVLDVGRSTPLFAVVFHLILSLLFAAITSFVQAVLFAALGAEIARPMWKYTGWRDALRRFFITWLIINLSLITIIDVRARLLGAGVSDLATTLELFLLAAHLLSLPAGAAIMFHGALNWREVPMAMSPLTRFFQLTMAPLGFALFQYVLITLRAQLVDAGTAVGVAVYGATDIPLVLLDVLIFALIWRICMLNQTTPSTGNEDPLDF